MNLYFHPMFPYHYILEDDERRYWLVPANSTGTPRSPYRGPTATRSPVPAQQTRVLLATWHEVAQ